MATASATSMLGNSSVFTPGRAGSPLLPRFNRRGGSACSTFKETWCRASSRSHMETGHGSTAASSFCRPKCSTTSRATARSGSVIQSNGSRRKVNSPLSFTAASGIRWIPFATRPCSRTCGNQAGRLGSYGNESRVLQDRGVLGRVKSGGSRIGAAIPLPRNRSADLGHLPELLGRQPVSVAVASVLSVGLHARHGLPLPDGWLAEANYRLDHIHVVELVRLARFVPRDEDLVQFLAWAYPNVLDSALRRDRAREIHGPHARQLRYEDLPAHHLLDAAEDEVHTLLEREPESRHPLVGDRDRARLALLQEEWNHAPPAAHDVAIAAAAERRPADRVRVDVSLREEFLRDELRRTVEIDRIHGLIGADRHDLLHATVDRRVDHALRTADVGLHGLDRVVLEGRHLLQCCRVNDDVDAVHGAREPPFVAHVTDEPTHARVSEPEVRAHLFLFQLVATVDDDASDRVLAEESIDELPAERTGPSGDQNCPSREAACHVPSLLNVCHGRVLHRAA